MKSGVSGLKTFRIFDMRTKLTLILLAVSLGTILAQPDDRIARTPKVTYDWQPGFVCITEVTFAPGLGLIDDGLSRYYFGLTTVAGYQFTRNIKAGAGLGFHVHEEETLFPVYLDIRYSMNSQQFVPFISGSGGIMLAFSDLVENTRVFINPAIGVKYVAARKLGVSFSTGLMVTTGGPNARKSFVNFKLGLELKGKK